MISTTRVAPMLLLIAAIFSLGSSPCKAAELAPALEVMSFNIRFATAKDGPDRWEVRKPRLLQVMKKYAPDLVGLQEAQASQVNDLLEAFPTYQIAGVGRDDGKESGEFSPIMYDAKRLRLLRSDTFWLSDTPEVPGSTHWGNRNLRLCTWAYFKDLETQKYFYLYNTHLDHVSQESRMKSVRLILDRINNSLPKDPVLITGDFNAAEDNPVIDSVREAGFRDSFRVLHPDVKVVGTTTGFRPERQIAKIDYVFVDKNWQVEAAAIVEDKVDDRWPSDHLPVTARLKLN